MSEEQVDGLMIQDGDRGEWVGGKRKNGND